ncbi:3'(2'),5'-bisphosphate nucleotidase CysQ [Sphingomonas suaedae]|uniref:3'(2'),5'-bisphosphate nucleotidase CysQ n=1 Tax=Sphingomonas suaedae TaxID=2599297 RepID=A0A518REF7_9SPHN|nr:3'(2'),5'-bisphosphate nucleotidase CysQ [Sphingomonas suaedae]QDX25837.1 3'(2'),5'-bisphosphate nucleotidase CysQ [Sphingomonas suaedae]
MADGLARAVSAVAAEAGRLAHARFGTDVRKWEKSPNNFVCEVDLAVDELLRARLSALLPDAGWLSEETADDLARLSHRRVWVVDPIDGTRDYLRGRPGWAVSIALVEDGQPVIGVLDAPARGEHWIGVRDAGATRGGDQIAASGRADLPGARVPADDLPAVDQDLVMVPRPNSIALRMAMVAAGEADLLATFRWGADWDIAAAVLIAREAGATVTDALGKKLRFNTPRGESFGLLATAPGIHAAAADRLRPRAVEALGKP